MSADHPVTGDDKHQRRFVGSTANSPCRFWVSNFGGNIAIAPHLTIRYFTNCPKNSFLKFCTDQAKRKVEFLSFPQQKLTDLSRYTSGQLGRNSEINRCIAKAEANDLVVVTQHLTKTERCFKDMAFYEFTNLAIAKSSFWMWLISQSPRILAILDTMATSSGFCLCSL